MGVLLPHNGVDSKVFGFYPLWGIINPIWSWAMETCDLKVRLSADLKTKLQIHAEANDRSMNGELVQILKQHFGLTNLSRKRLQQKRAKVA
ncbi:MAG: hypothetical protein ABS75_24055 [Pelagibacterium sp. SCN 63-23]|nr:MAG: hypothetical protein ABS75_24055 [Pelagibacterium sp. SCN 63-23]